MRSNLIACTADEKRPGAVGLNQLAWLSTARMRGLDNRNSDLYHRGLDKTLIHLNMSVDMQNDVPGGKHVSVGAKSSAEST